MNVYRQATQANAMVFYSDHCTQLKLRLKNGKYSLEDGIH